MKQNAQRQVAGEWFRKMAVVGLWFFAITVLVLVIILAISAVIPEPIAWETFIFHPALVSILLLVLGIVLTLVHIESYISRGITRSQLTRGVLMAVLAFSLFAALIYAAVYLLLVLMHHPFIEIHDIPFQTLTNLIANVFCYLIGWGIAIVIIYMRTYINMRIMILSIISFTLCFNVWSNLIGAPAFWNVPNALPSLLFRLGIVVLLGVGITLVITRTMRRLPISC